MRIRGGVVASILTVALATLAADPAAAGDCAPHFPTPRLVTPDTATIPKGGGLLVAETIESGPVTAESGAISSWRFLDAKKRRVAPKQRLLAPGLIVLEPIGTRLENAKRGKIRTFTLGKDAGTALAAPAVKSVEQSRSSAGYRVYTDVTVELKEAPSADQFLVVLDKDGKKPRSFGLAKAGTKAVLVYTAGECTILPTGTLVTQTGDSITLAWVDATGRMSAPSAAVTVKSKPEDPSIAPYP